MTYRTLIVDDEDYARDIVRSLLKTDPDITLVGECSNGTEAIAAIEAEKPDIVFLDIQMPEVNGFEVIERASGLYQPHYIFTTAYDEFAPKAFEVNAIDYLLKPFDDDRFFQALNRAKEKAAIPASTELKKSIAALLKAHQQNQANYLKRISVKTGGKIHFIAVEDIEWIEADNQYVKIHTANRHHTHRASLTELETTLDPATFMRIHRSAIVNIHSITSLEPHFRGDFMVNLQSGTKVKLAHTRKEALRQLMGW